jgi:hypothetical protein
LGSILAQLVVGVNDLSSAWLGKTILMYVRRADGCCKLTELMNCFSLTICNISGAIFTKLWVPNPCDINGESRKLEDLSHGKDARKMLEDLELKMRLPPA